MKYYLGIILLSGFLFSGCAAVNDGLDKTNDVASEAGKPVGKVMSLPGSVAEGAADGMIRQDPKDNPFGR